ncbi:uncharacterized protein PRCAT00005538001 [Priceomyces carsonii]|uniref:uncharacterized protein n=1 Tax=Priceomyces carsonii TaxID=28549 RepID=UPI002ED9AB8F|nr:unnamed protein product [Priceomyces carsonii]
MIDRPHKKVIPGQYIVPSYNSNKKSGKIEKFLAGEGTTIYEVESDDSPSRKVPIIVSTRLGDIKYKNIGPLEEEKSIGPVEQILVMVLPKSNVYTQHSDEISDGKYDASVSINLPKENDIVLVRITRINQKQANCEILSVEGHGNILTDHGLGSNGESAHLSVPSGGGAQSLSSHQGVASSQSTSLNAVAVDLGETFKGIIRTQDIRSTDRDKVKMIELFKPGDIVRAIIISLGDGSNYYLSTARNDLGVVFSRSEGSSGDVMFPIDWQHMLDNRTGQIEKRKCAKPFA